MKLHHVQVSCPPGGEDEARRFYGEGLGLNEIPKPSTLAGRGGVWFRDGLSGHGGAEVHVGVEEDFRPARKAHPAFVFAHEQELNQIAARLESLGYNVDWNEKETFPGYLRFHTFDGNGNRVEILSP